MKLEIVVDCNFLEALFKTQGNSEKIEIASKLSRHILIASTELLNIWEEHMKNSNLEELYNDWLLDISTSQARFKKVNLRSNLDADVLDKESILLENSKISKQKILIVDFDDNTMNKYIRDQVKFVNWSAMSASKKQQVTVIDIENYYKNNIPLKKDIFNLFETPVNIQVSSGTSSNTLSKYLAEFYDEDSAFIHDTYIATNALNEKNFSTYVLSYLKELGTKNVQIANFVENGSRKAPLERKHGIKVKSVQKTNGTNHTGYIKTSKYKITIPYRMQVFGDNNRNCEDSITISRTS